jgi:hypothetical protein
MRWGVAEVWPGEAVEGRGHNWPVVSMHHQIIGRLRERS